MPVVWSQAARSENQDFQHQLHVVLGLLGGRWSIATFNADNLDTIWQRCGSRLSASYDLFDLVFWRRDFDVHAALSAVEITPKGNCSNHAG